MSKVSCFYVVHQFPQTSITLDGRNSLVCRTAKLRTWTVMSLLGILTSSVSTAMPQIKRELGVLVDVLHWWFNMIRGTGNISQYTDALESTLTRTPKSIQAHRSRLTWLKVFLQESAGGSMHRESAARLPDLASSSPKSKDASTSQQQMGTLSMLAERWRSRHFCFSITRFNSIRRQKEARRRRPSFLQPSWPKPRERPPSSAFCQIECVRLAFTELFTFY